MIRLAKSGIVSEMFKQWTTVFLMLSATPAYAVFCDKWEPGKSIGTLSPKDVREASGMAASAAYPNRVYWINDSGDKGFFYYGGPDGKNLQKVKIAHFKPRDTEAIAVTVCNEGPCLAIGDIGDNKSVREHIKISFIAERKDYPDGAKILRTLTLEYPDGAHDAEAMAFLPGGDLLIVTKEIHLSKLDVGAAGVYTLGKTEWSGDGDKTLKLKKAGELPLPKWLEGDLFFTQAATDMAVNPVRKVLGILTYGKAVEISLAAIGDLANAANWRKGREYNVIAIEALAQQEGLTYLPDPDRMLWSTEYRIPEAPIFSMTCALPAP
jgi:hypothetical protein